MLPTRIGEIDYIEIEFTQYGAGLECMNGTYWLCFKYNDYIYDYWVGVVENSASYYISKKTLASGNGYGNRMGVFRYVWCKASIFIER